MDGSFREPQLFELAQRPHPVLRDGNPTDLPTDPALMGRKPLYISGFRPINIVLSGGLGHGRSLAGKCARVGAGLCQVSGRMRTKKGPASAGPWCPLRGEIP